MARMPHKPICSATATNHSWLSRFSQRPGRSRKLAPTSSAATSIKKRLVPSSTSTIARATPLCDWLAHARARPVNRLSASNMPR